MANLNEQPTSVIMRGLETIRPMQLETPAPRPVLSRADVTWADSLIQHDYDPALSPIVPGAPDTEDESCGESENASVLSDPNSVNNSLSDDSSCSPLMSSVLSPSHFRKLASLDAVPRKPLSPPFKPHRPSSAAQPARRALIQPHTSAAPHHHHHHHHQPQQIRNAPGSRAAVAAQLRGAAAALQQHRGAGHLAHNLHPLVPAAHQPADPSPTASPPPHLAVVLSPPPEPTPYTADLHIEPLSLPQPAAAAAPPRAAAHAHHGMAHQHHQPAPAPAPIPKAPARHPLGAFPATPAGLLSASRSLLSGQAGGQARAAPKKRGGNGRTKGVSKAQSTGKPRRFCHICRSPKDLDKIVFCASKKQSHVFCSGCVGRRLGLSFEELLLNDRWMCPKCEGHCPCSKCRKRYPQDPPNCLPAK